MKNLFLICLCFALLFSCKQEPKETIVDNVEEVVNKYTSKPFSPSVKFPDAGISSMSYVDGVFDFGISGESYKLGTQSSDVEVKMCANSGKGQHIHLIVDNAPYAAKYTSNFEHKIEDGDHYLLAFLSRSYHESIKTNAAHTAQAITVKNNSITSSEDVTSPMLFYSRPKGTYVGKDTKNLMLDFYLSNINLSADGYKVKADINGEEHIFDKWQPYYLDGLPYGENTIQLTLIDKDGKAVDAPLNPVSRTFTLKKDELER